jgi:soluble cytochrome b562
MRRNTGTSPTITAAQLSGMAKANGLSALAHKLDKDPAYADKAVTIINSLFAAAAAKKAAAEAEAARAAAEKAKVHVPPPEPAAPSGSAELSDREAYTMLAGLVDQVLTDLTGDERSAIKAAFLEEAQKAA